MIQIINKRYLQKITFLPHDVKGPNVQENSAKPFYCNHLLEKRNFECGECGALMWYDEKTHDSSIKTPKFSSCCASGKVKLPTPKPLTVYMDELINNKKFMSKIRFYNASFAFISFNASSDNNLIKNSVYTFRVQGMIHHRIGPLIQDNKYNKQCAQIYIMDGAQQEELRQNYSEDLDIIILKKIRIMLESDCNNPYVNTFKTAAKIYKNNPESDIKTSTVTDKNEDKRRYNKPTATEIAILIPSMGESSEPTERKGFIFHKNGTLRNIDANQAAYDPLQYPLIFPYGCPGWEYKQIKLNLDSKSVTSKKKIEKETLMNDNGNFYK